jgi:hypothetical protein
VKTGTKLKQSNTTHLQINAGKPTSIQLIYKPNRPTTYPLNSFKQSTITTAAMTANAIY